MIKITGQMTSRVGETMNWLHEDDGHLVTRERAIEAAEYYQEMYCREVEKGNRLKSSLLIFAMKKFGLRKNP